MKGHSHPGAFETLGLQSVDIGGRECTIHILLKYVAPVFAAKILQEEKSIVIAQLVYVVKKNLSTFIESVVGNGCIHRPSQNPQDSLQVGSERDGERDLSTERTLIGWNWFFISSYIALLVAMNVFKYVQYIGITNGEIIL